MASETSVRQSDASERASEGRTDGRARTRPASPSCGSSEERSAQLAGRLFSVCRWRNKRGHDSAILHLASHVRERYVRVRTSMQGSKHAQPHYLRSSWLGRRDDQSEVTLARGLINGPILIFIAHVREEKERAVTCCCLAGMARPR